MCVMDRPHDGGGLDLSRPFGSQFGGDRLHGRRAVGLDLFDLGGVLVGDLLGDGAGLMLGAGHLDLVLEAPAEADDQGDRHGGKDHLDLSEHHGVSFGLLMSWVTAPAT